VSGKVVVFSVLFTTLIILSVSTPAWAAQLEARINPDSITSDFVMIYQRTIFIEYNEGGQIADLLRQQSWTNTVTADSSDPGVADLMDKLNLKFFRDKSSVKISDLSIDHERGWGIKNDTFNFLRQMEVFGVRRRNACLLLSYDAN